MRVDSLRKTGQKLRLIAFDTYAHKLRIADVKLLSWSFLEFRNDPYQPYYLKQYFWKERVTKKGLSISYKAWKTLHTTSVIKCQ